MVGVSVQPFSAAKHHDDRTGVPGYIGFSVSVTTAGAEATVWVTGDVDCYTSPELRTALVALIQEGAQQVTIDVSGSQFIDSTGLSVLVGALKRLRENGGNMVVKSPSDPARRLFEITGLDTVFEVS